MKRVVLNTKPVIYNVKDVNRMVFHIFFPIKFKKKNIVNRILLRRMQITCSNKYKTSQEFNEVMDNNYIMNYTVDYTGTENYDVLEYILVVPKEDIISIKKTIILSKISSIIILRTKIHKWL